MLEDFMALRSIPYARLDGSTTRPRRALDIKLVSYYPFKYFLNLTNNCGMQFQQENSRK